MRILVVLPMLTAAAAVLCALWPPARRLCWPVVALAALNVIATPFTSGEWFYQHAEDAAYQRAVARGDFAALELLVGQHDPHLLPRMVVLAVALLITCVGLAMLQARAGKGGRPSPALSGIVIGAVLLAAVATLVQGGLLLVG